MGLNVPNIVGSQGLFSASPNDDQVLTSQGPREIPEDQPEGSVSTSTAITKPGTMADDATVGTRTWSNVNNAKISDDVYSTATLVEP